jgi:hypothetical protein
MDSPVSHLLNTNCIPSDEEIQQIRHIIAKGDNDLSHLDAKITLIEATIDVLHAQREKIQEHVDAHRALLSPIRRLPEDIMEEIFLRCLPENQYPAITRVDSVEASVIVTFLFKLMLIWLIRPPSSLRSSVVVGGLLPCQFHACGPLFAFLLFGGYLLGSQEAPRYFCPQLII